NMMPILFPYTTLFRSPEQLSSAGINGLWLKNRQVSGFNFIPCPLISQQVTQSCLNCCSESAAPACPTPAILRQSGWQAVIDNPRSEEHTSELQSRENL